MAQEMRRWFPSPSQLKDPDSLQQVFQQLLTKHYALEDHVKSLNAPVTKGAAPAASDTPTGTKLVGLHVLPVDVQTLDDGAMLKFDKKAGNFRFTL